jgi:hypothetical protein
MSNGEKDPIADALEDPVADALEGLNEIAQGRSPAQLARRTEREEFRQRLSAILAGLPELKEEDVVEISAAAPDEEVQKAISDAFANLASHRASEHGVDLDEVNEAAVKAVEAAVQNAYEAALADAGVKVVPADVEENAEQGRAAPGSA